MLGENDACDQRFELVAHEAFTALDQGEHVARANGVSRDLAHLAHDSGKPRHDMREVIAVRCDFAEQLDRRVDLPWRSAETAIVPGVVSAAWSCSAALAAIRSACGATGSPHAADSSGRRNAANTIVAIWRMRFMARPQCFLESSVSELPVNRSRSAAALW